VLRTEKTDADLWRRCRSCDSTIKFQKNIWFSELYIQEVKAQRFKASFYF
jgi:hypothetical protein